MAQLRVSAQARRDFDMIVSDLETEAGASIAIDYARQISAAINRVSVYPGIGSPP
jgi:plasmid stabilization system protein ParE